MGASKGKGQYPPVVQTGVVCVVVPTVTYEGFCQGKRHPSKPGTVTVELPVQTFKSLREAVCREPIPCPGKNGKNGKG